MTQCAMQSIAAPTAAVTESLHAAKPSLVEIDGKTFPTGSAYNIPPHVVQLTSAKLHLQPEHPLCITRQIIESCFPTFEVYNKFHAVVSTFENYESIGIPMGQRPHAYYINEETMLRTHMSGHQLELFSLAKSGGCIATGDAYRRDTIDGTHYHAHHQVEGIRFWDRQKVPGGDVVKAIYDDLAKMPKCNLGVEDYVPPSSRPKANSLLRRHHSAAEIEALVAHLKHSVALVVDKLLTKLCAVATMAATDQAGVDCLAQDLKLRWVSLDDSEMSDVYFDLEVYYQGQWVELLGGGVINQETLINSGVPSRLGWSFGIGLDRAAMILFQIPELRLLWEQDGRFLDQFKGLQGNLYQLRLYVPFSDHLGCNKDETILLPMAAANSVFHESDVMEIIRNTAGIDMVQTVVLLAKVENPQTSLCSLCYRITYRRLDRVLTDVEIISAHERVRTALSAKLGAVISAGTNDL